jgi:hypothetical protein
VLPKRALSASVVLAGMAADQFASLQAIVPAASMIRDVNVPEVAYGVTRSQSTLTAPPPRL